MLQVMAPTMKTKLVKDIEAFQREVKRFKHEVHCCFLFAMSPL